ncbi:MAG: long-chain fatty acid--CoA ligase, partial [Candidatus Acidiferrum sp.]
YSSLPASLLRAIDQHPSPRAQMFRSTERWEAISSQEFLRRIAGLANCLVELGLKNGDRVGLFAPNCPEWHTADFAINGSGAVTVPVYFNESPDRMIYILNHCGAQVLFIAGLPQLEKFLTIRDQFPQIQQVIVANAGNAMPSDFLRYETLIATAGPNDIAAYRTRVAKVSPGQLASIIYTSGTTGEPKGVMLTHSNFSSNVTDSCHDLLMYPETDLAVSFLPLAHVYGRMLDYLYIFQGCPIAYVDVVENVAQALLEVHPTVLAAVPRFFEKIYARLMEQGGKTTGVKRKIFAFAMQTAREAGPWRSGESSASLPLKLKWALANRLVYSKIRTGTGGRLRLVLSGGAPLSKSLGEFFWAIGIPIYQGYGLTETSPVLTNNYPRNRVGSSGQPIDNVQICIADDGEILAKGPCVMQGYYKSPESTREVLSEDGWFKTGDIGYLDKDNYLFITDRKKDLLKTAAGKFVAPQPIENILKTSPYILNAMVVGDQRKFVVALIVINPAALGSTLADEGLTFSSPAEMAAHPRTYSLIESEVHRLTSYLAQYETIKRFALLPEDFTFASGALTFTMKLKRRVVETQFHHLIDKLYADVIEPRPQLQRD